ncbi:MAG: hypothetical protein M5U20_05730 [Phycisphaerales bacterium]|nr:hypothetical protein [Phycisphaerales bacterium]
MTGPDIEKSTSSAQMNSAGGVEAADALSSDPLTEEGLREAARFLAGLREAQRLSGRRLGGHRYLSDRTRLASAAAQEASRMVRAVASGADGEAVRQAVDALEEMCRRRGLQMPENLRHSIYQVLAGEILANAAMLRATPAEVASATAYNGALAELVDSDEFASLRDTPGVFKRAAVHNPSDPEGFLRKVQATVAALERDPEFEPLRDSPSVFMHAAASYPSDPQGFLRKVLATVAALERDPEFEPLRRSPSVFRHAAAGYPSDPKGFLRKVLGTVAALEGDEEFASLRGTPGAFRYAAVNNPSDPKGALRKVIATAAELERDPELESLRDSPSVFRHAAVHNPSDPKSFLKKLIATVGELERDPEFEPLRKSPSVFRRAAVGHPSDPQGFLRKVLSTHRNESHAGSVEHGWMECMRNDRGSGGRER